MSKKGQKAISVLVCLFNVFTMSPAVSSAAEAAAGSAAAAGHAGAGATEGIGPLGWGILAGLGILGIVVVALDDDVAPDQYFHDLHGGH